MTDNEVDAAKAVLRGFMERMCQWETLYHHLFSQENRDFELDKSNAAKDLALIYADFVTNRQRKTGRLSHIHAGYPAEFDHSRDEIIATEALSDKKIVISTKWRDGISDDYFEDRKYTLIRQADAWRLDKVEAFDDYSQKWKSRPL